MDISCRAVPEHLPARGTAKGGTQGKLDAMRYRPLHRPTGQSPWHCHMRCELTSSSKAQVQGRVQRAGRGQHPTPPGQRLSLASKLPVPPSQGLPCLLSSPRALQMTLCWELRVLERQTTLFPTKLLLILGSALLSCLGGSIDLFGPVSPSQEDSLDHHWSLGERSRDSTRGHRVEEEPGERAQESAASQGWGTRRWSRRG